MTNEKFLYLCHHIQTKDIVYDEQKDFYLTVLDSTKEELFKSIELNGLEKSRMSIFSALLRLRQICCHPRLYDKEGKLGISESGKFEHLQEMLEEIIEVLFYLTKKDPRLGAISIKTNLNKVKNIGSETNLDLVKDEDVLINKNNIIYGFGVHAGKAFGVSGIYCYFIDKTLYGIILYDGLLQLRSKCLKKENLLMRNKNLFLILVIYPILLFSLLLLILYLNKIN